MADLIITLATQYTIRVAEDTPEQRARAVHEAFEILYEDLNDHSDGDENGALTAQVRVASASDYLYGEPDITLDLSAEEEENNG